MEKQSNRNLIVLIIILSGIWIIYSAIFNIYSYSFGIIFAACYLLLFLCLNIENKYYVILFTLPFASIFKISSDLPSVLIILLSLYLFHVLIIKSIKIKTTDYLFLIAIILFQVLSIYIYQGSYISLLSFILNILFMKACILNFNSSSSKKQILFKSSYTFGTSMFISILVSDIFPNIPYIVLLEKQTLLMSINRFSGLNGDPNYFNQLILIAICLLFASLLKVESKHKWVLFLLYLFLILSGFRSISKSYALSIIVVFILSLYYKNKLVSFKSEVINVKALKLLLSYTLLVAGAISLFILSKFVVIPVFQARTDTDDILTGRGDIWIHYLKLLVQNPEILLTGVGFSNDATVLGKHFGIYMVPHNVYLEILVDCGLIVMCLLFLFFKEIFTNFKLKRQDPYFMFFIVILFTSFGLSLSSNDAFFIFLPLMTLIGGEVNNNEKISNHHTYTSQWRS